jgi:DNA-binding SARP family transcriptional activator
LAAGLAMVLSELPGAGRLVRDEEPVLVCLLGTFRLLVEGRLVAVRTGGKTEALLGHLALAGAAGLPREALLNWIWPTAEPALALQALKSLLHALRRVVGNALGGDGPVVQGSGYVRLNSEAGVGVDVTHFHRLVASAQEDQQAGDLARAARWYEHALAVYRGDLAMFGKDQMRTLIQRERLRATYLSVLVRLADLAYARGDLSRCLAYTSQLLDHDPGREDAHRYVMRCYVRLGQRAQALRYYDTVCAVLLAEFNAAPEPATQALLEQIRLDPGAI